MQIGARGVSNGNQGRVQGTPATKILKKQGKQSNLSEGKKSSKGSKGGIMEPGGLGGKLVLEGKIKELASQVKVGAERGPLREIQQVQASAGCVLESNLEAYRNEGVGSRDKENLHLGEMITGEACGIEMEFDVVGNEKECLFEQDCNGMACVTVYATLNLVDDQ